MTGDTAAPSPSSSPPPAPSSSPSPARSPAGGSSRWSTVGAYLSLAFVVWFVLEAAVLAISPRAFNDLHRAEGSLVARLVAVAVWFGVLVHGLDGLRTTIVDLGPRAASASTVLTVAVRFLTFAVGIPVALVLLWPAVRGWWS